jgi:hypothetical protein
MALRLARPGARMALSRRAVAPPQLVRLQAAPSRGGARCAEGSAHGSFCGAAAPCRRGGLIHASSARREPLPRVRNAFKSSSASIRCHSLSVRALRLWLPGTKGHTAAARLSTSLPCTALHQHALSAALATVRRSEDIPLFRPDGSKVTAGEAAKGPVVVALLRHLG